MSKFAHLNCSLLILVLVGTVAMVVAQTGTSNISGTVRDTAGAVVPGATVSAKNEATGVTSTR